jgi:hypothetical protein
MHVKAEAVCLCKSKQTMTGTMVPGRWTVQEFGGQSHNPGVELGAASPLRCACQSCSAEGSSWLLWPTPWTARTPPAPGHLPQMWRRPHTRSDPSIGRMTCDGWQEGRDWQACVASRWQAGRGHPTFQHQVVQLGLQLSQTVLCVGAPDFSSLLFHRGICHEGAGCTITSPTWSTQHTQGGQG